MHIDIHTLRGLREAAAILLPSQVTSGGSNQISVKLSCQEISRDHWRKNILECRVDESWGARGAEKEG